MYCTAGPRSAVGNVSGYECVSDSTSSQWHSGRVLDSRPKGRGFEPHRRHCVVSLGKNINPSLVLVQPRKTRPFITERLLMGRKESNQTNKQKLQIQGSRVKSRSGPILSWRLIMKLFLRSFTSLQLIYSRRVVVSYKRKYVHELLVNRLFKPAQEKVWLGELTVPP